MSEIQNAPAISMPKTRSQVARRADPEARSLVFREIRILNQRPDRRYILVDRGAGGGRELICPENMLDDGWEYERWDSIVRPGAGYGGEDVYEAREGALRFAGGSRVGPPGSVIETRGCALMSKDLEAWEAAKEAGQRSADPRERAIRNQALQAKEARDEIKRAQVPERYARVSQMTEDEIAPFG